MHALINGQPYVIDGDLDWNGFYEDYWRVPPTCPACGEAIEHVMLRPTRFEPKAVACPLCEAEYPLGEDRG